MRLVSRTCACTALALLIALVTIAPRPIAAQNPSAPPSLRTVAVPEPANLGQFVKSKAAAIALGKALFWDMQVGSDGVQACASCHFHAGADNRFKNVVSPGLNATPADTSFQAAGPNTTLSQDRFPFTQFADPGDQTTALIRNWNDVVSSPGVYSTAYIGQPLNNAVEQGAPTPDPVFNVGGVNTRRVEPRNAPTVINAVFNVANFWDGRANNVFNGENPFGDADPRAGVWVATVNANPDETTWVDVVRDAAGVPVLVKQRVRIPFASLASQAVGPPGSAFEMSFAGRTFPDLGRKLLDPRLVPLGKQQVHPDDSVLAPYANSTVSRRKLSLKPGLHTTYAAMVQAAFHDQFWNSTQLLTPLPGPRSNEEFTQMQANFALFFGLAVQVYEATLVSDDSPYDRFQAGDATALNGSAQEGLNIFLAVNEPGGVGGNCINCHGTSTFSNASTMHVGATNFGASLPEGLIERMLIGDGNGAFYDSGYYNIGVRPIVEDPGRGGRDPFGNVLSFTDRALLVFNGNGSQLSFDPALTVPLPCGPGFVLVCPADQRSATLGSFKVPTLRNVELTGPYMHNGGEATLMQVMDFYARGGNFRDLSTFDADIQPLFGLNPNPVLNPGGLSNPVSGATAEENQRKVVDFLLSLTDERVRWERAPFDHPALSIPNGATVKRGATQATDTMLNVPAVGAGGLAVPIGRFLNLDPYQP
jgi:cytochrome c peroxidase